MAIVSLDQVIQTLKDGDVAAIPTETVYGLAARIDSDEALKKIFAVKRRPLFDPLIVHVHSRNQVKNLAGAWPDVFDVLADRFWPGPLTFVAWKSSTVSSLITSGLDTVAVRCPAHPVALEILRRLNVPLAAPSANRFGHTSPTTAAHVESEFGGKIPVVDGGPCAVGVESTVVSATKVAEKWEIQILRPGGISRSQIREALSAAGLEFEITRVESSASPGHLKAHYQPDCPLFISPLPWSAQLAKDWSAKLRCAPEEIQQLVLPPTPWEAARTLYGEFRRLSQGPTAAIFIERLPQHSGEEWEAVWDRIERASSPLD